MIMSKLKLAFLKLTGSFGGEDRGIFLNRGVR
jgi:hypothetical protein